MYARGGRPAEDVCDRHAEIERTGGRVALLYVIEPAEFKHWMAVEDIMRQERREEAEALLHEVSGDVQELSGKTPVYFLREGNLADELLELINEERSISILVLARADKTP